MIQNKLDNWTQWDINN